jgi:hypothetical protein
MKHTQLRNATKWTVQYKCTVWVMAKMFHIDKNYTGLTIKVEFTGVAEPLHYPFKVKVKKVCSDPTHHTLNSLTLLNISIQWTENWSMKWFQNEKQNVLKNYDEGSNGAFWWYF